MTPQETLHEISVMVYRNTDNFEMRISKDCYKGLVNALEKQIPKKPKYIDGDYDLPLCPSCGLSVDEDKEIYCSICGQALDWGDNE